MSESKLLRLPEVLKRTGLSRSSLYAYIKSEYFPQQVKIGERSIAWREQDVEAWIASRICSKTHSS